MDQQNDPNLYGGKTPNPLEKSSQEKTLYNGSTDTRSDEWNPKNIVAIIGTEEKGNVLEIPLLLMSSPWTLIQTKDENEQRVFD